MNVKNLQNVDLSRRIPIVPGWLRTTLVRLAWLAIASGSGVTLAAALLLALHGASTPVASAAGPWYVSPSGSDANSCDAALTPCLTIQSAITRASPGDTILVAAGTYTAAAGSQVVSVTQPVTLSGGWDATFTIQNGTSVVDGESARRGFTIQPNAPTLIISFTVQNGTASEGGAITASTGSPLTLTNVSVLSNTATGSGGGVHAIEPVVLNGGRFENNTCTGVGCFGGGLFVTNTLTITGTEFISNTAYFSGGAFAEKNTALNSSRFERNVCTGASCFGGGLNTHGDLVMTGTQFISNTAPNRAGGLDVWGVTVITNSLFQGNSTSGFGGGLYVDDIASVTGTLFISNTSGFEGGGAYVTGAATIFDSQFINNSGSRGGGLYADDGATVMDSWFEDNTALASHGGGIQVLGNLTLTNTTFLSNTAKERGGGVDADAVGALSIEGARFEGNQTQFSQGGGLYVGPGANGTIQDTLFENNTAGGNGGGVFFDSTSSLNFQTNQVISNQATSGGGVYVFSQSVVYLDNNVIAANTASSGAAEVGLNGPTATVVGRHNTFAAAIAGSGTAVLLGNVVASDTLALTNSIFDGYAIGVQTGGFTASAALTGVLWSNVTTPTQAGLSPITVTGDYTGSAAFVGAGDYHLTANSAALSRGITTTLLTDFEGQARPAASAPDLGADEFTTDLAITKAVTPTMASSGDPITYTLAFTNVGSQLATSVLITDILSSDYLTSPAFTNTGAVLTPTNGITFAWQAADLAPGASGLITLTAIVSPGLTSTVTFTNTALITTPEDVVATTNNTSLQPLTAAITLSGLSAVSSSPTPLGSATLFTASVASGSSPVFTWAFGDGATGSGATVSHTYASLGVYTAVVTATNSVNTLTTTVPVTVTDAAISGLSATSNSPTTLGSATAFTATIASGTNVAYTWGFGDGSTGSGITTTHTYAAVGNYVAVVTATNSVNTVTATLPVTITDVAIAGLSITVAPTPTVGVSSTFTASVTAGTNVAYAWDINGTFVGSGPSITYKFLTTGTYTVTVNASNGAGNASTFIVITIPNRLIYLPVILK